MGISCSIYFGEGTCMYVHTCRVVMYILVDSYDMITFLAHARIVKSPRIRGSTFMPMAPYMGWKQLRDQRPR